MVAREDNSCQRHRISSISCQAPLKLKSNYMSNWFSFTVYTERKGTEKVRVGKPRLKEANSREIRPACEKFTLNKSLEILKYVQDSELTQKPGCYHTVT